MSPATSLAEGTHWIDRARVGRAYVGAHEDWRQAGGRVLPHGVGQPLCVQGVALLLLTILRASTGVSVGAGIGGDVGVGGDQPQVGSEPRDVCCLLHRGVGLAAGKQGIIVGWSWWTGQWGMSRGMAGWDVVVMVAAVVHDTCGGCYGLSPGHSWRDKDQTK